MTDDPIFGKALARGYMVMLDCKTRRSLLRTLSHCSLKHIEEYENKRWKIKHESGCDYTVIDKTDETEYMVRGSSHLKTKYLNKRKTEWELYYSCDFSIYKRKEK